MSGWAGPAFPKAPSGRRIELIAAICVSLIILAIGWSRLYDPFAGDQALFLIGAEKLQAGGVLYRDFWDIKQPGVFAFFLLGGWIFGFNQIGEHAADLVWQLAFVCALVFGLRASFKKHLFVAAFAPIAVVGAYYSGSSSWHLLQRRARRITAFLLHVGVRRSASQVVEAPCARVGTLRRRRPRI